MIGLRIDTNAKLARKVAQFWSSDAAPSTPIFRREVPANALTGRPGSWPVLTSVFPPDRRGEDGRSKQSHHTSGIERDVRRDTPEHAADEAGRRNRDAADEVVQPNRSRAQVRLREIDNEGLACGLADFSKTAHDERADQLRQRVRGDDRDRKQREREER